MKSVEPLKTASQREQFELALADNVNGGLYLDVWRFAVNTGLRCGDNLALTMNQMKAIDKRREYPELSIVEQKTGKPKTLVLNAGAMAVITKRLAEHPTHIWLFQSPLRPAYRQEPKHVSMRAVSARFSAAGNQILPKVRVCTHSARKTRAYYLYKECGVTIDEISSLLNHANTQVTRRYVGITQESEAQTYINHVL